MLLSFYWHHPVRISIMKVIALLFICVAATNAFRTGYVIGGVDTTIEEWPFMVSIQQYSSHFCGAALFDEAHAITAGHCVIGTNPSQITLMLGTNSVDRPQDPQYIDVIDIIVHEDYGQGRGLQNDIAVLVLASEADTSGVVETITLAPADSEDFAGADCEIAGWGQTDDDYSPDILQEASVNVITTSQCQDDWGWAEDSHICFRDDTGEFGACFGDSGGPLTCIDSDGNRVLAGVTSGGSGDCDTSIAAYYTRISYFYDWIQDNL